MTLLVGEGICQRNGTLGSPKLIERDLRLYYKRRPLKLAELDRLGWDRFIRNEVNDRSGKREVRDVIVDAITKDVSLKSFSLNRKTLFPIKDWLMKKVMLIVYIGFLFIGVGRILLDVFREEPFNYLNILISALSFFSILSYINKKLEKEN